MFCGFFCGLNCQFPPYYFTQDGYLFGYLVVTFEIGNRIPPKTAPLKGYRKCYFSSFGDFFEELVTF
jgi:hypothetical protein